MSVTIEQALVLLNQLLQQQLQLCVCSVCVCWSNKLSICFSARSAPQYPHTSLVPGFLQHVALWLALYESSCPILQLDNMVALVWRREIVHVTGAHAVVVEARPLPKVAGYMVPRSFAVAFDSEDKCCRHPFDHTEVCRQGNEQLDDAFGGSSGPSDNSRDHAGVDPDHRWWQFVSIAGLNIVVGSYSKKQGLVAAPRSRERIGI